MINTKVDYLVEPSELVGEIIIAIDKDRYNEFIDFTLVNGEIIRMYHEQDCCEDVRLEDICGDLQDLINEEILICEERSQDDPNADESATWTFYEFATIKGSVTFRWYGESNGYYSEEAYLIRIK